MQQSMECCPSGDAGPCGCAHPGHRAGDRALCAQHTCGVGCWAAQTAAHSPGFSALFFLTEHTDGLAKLFLKIKTS